MIRWRVLICLLAVVDVLTSGNAVLAAVPGERLERREVPAGSMAFSGTLPEAGARRELLAGLTPEQREQMREQMRQHWQKPYDRPEVQRQNWMNGGAEGYRHRMREDSPEARRLRDDRPGSGRGRP